MPSASSRTTGGASEQPLLAADRREAVAGVGAHLRERRLAAGLSLRQFAKQLGVSASFISQLENGKSQPSVATLYSICNELDITVDELFADAGVARPERSNDATADALSATDGAGPAAATTRRGNIDLGGALAAMAAEPTDTRSPVVRLGGGRRLVLDTGVTWEQLSTGGSQSVNFMLVTYDVGGSSTVDERLTRHSGYEYGYVISGELNVTLAFEDYQLGAGDAIAFDSATPHRLHNEGDVPVKSIWFVLGRDGHHDHGL